LSREIRYLEKNQRWMTKVAAVSVEPHQCRCDDSKESFLKDHCPFRTKKGFEFFL
jgi:hypothetical protein